MKNVAYGLLDLLLPLRCGGCLRPAQPPLCPECRRQAARLRLPHLGWAHLADGVLAAGPFAYAGPVAVAIKRAKTPGGHGLAPGLAALLWREIGLDPLPLPRTWVPSAPRRARARAVELPRVLAGPGAVELLARTGHAPKQTSLDPGARRWAPFGTFRVVAPPPPSVVLVDDVRTTGATALAAALALRAAGARRVLVLTLAVAGAPPGLSGRRHPDSRGAEFSGRDPGLSSDPGLSGREPGFTGRRGPAAAGTAR